jgi:hypothetical protein
MQLIPAEIKTILGECQPVFIEVSGDCDYAQRKRPVARVMTGVLVPSTRVATLTEKGFRKADYLRHCVDLGFPNPKGDWRPIFISHFVFSLSPAVVPAMLQPIGRLRSGPLAELRHWLAAHAARPGYVSV